MAFQMPLTISESWKRVMSDEEETREFAMNYKVRMSFDDTKCTITLDCDEVITVGVFIDALTQIIEDYKNLESIDH